MLTRLLPTALACLALLAAGCGSSDDSSDAGSSAPATPDSSGAVAISIKDIQFNPKTVTIKVGQTVRWTNDDAIAHNVTANDGADFKSDNLSKGDTFEFKADTAGTIKYECTIHPGQDGEITVQ